MLPIRLTSDLTRRPALSTRRIDPRLISIVVQAGSRVRHLYDSLSGNQRKTRTLAEEQTARKARFCKENSLFPRLFARRGFLAFLARM